LPAAVLAFCCLVSCLAAGCGQSEPAAVVAPQVVAPPQPPPVPPEVEAIADVSIRPGRAAKVPVRVKRNGNHGIIELVVQSPPQGIAVEGASIPAGTSRCELVITAAESLGDQELTQPLAVTGMVNGMPIQASFTVTVPQYEPPEFTVDDTVLLVQGRTRSVTLRCDRKGFPGPIGLSIGGATAAVAEPVGVSSNVESLEANEDSAALEITVAEDVADGVVTIPLEARVRERTITTELPFRVTRYPFRVGVVPAVLLAPGERRKVSLAIERNGYDGAISIEAVKAPAGLDLQPVTVPAEARSIEVELRAAADAADEVATLTLRCSGAELTIDRPLVVRISRGDDRSLPEAVGGGRKAALLRPGSFGGRLTFESKESLRGLYGGTIESDAAVMRGLAWLARVQQPDGGWMFQAVGSGADPAGPQPGEENRIAATAWGLLPFLAEGISHASAPDRPRPLAGYKPVVERGLVFLATNQYQGRGPGGGSWNAGLRAQALATIAFCEAYAVSGDRKPRLHAQQGVKFLIEAQDPASGGWRNTANDAPDLAVTAWAIMALRAAQLANVAVKAKHLDDAERFLRLCAAGPGERFESRYANGPGREAEPGLTAAALLARLSGEWSPERPDVLAGRDYVMQHLPPVEAAPLGDLFLYHFATRVLQQLEGAEFDTWNALVREHLIRNQRTDGELAGSWAPQGMRDADQGGRLYATALSLLTLQTYYRHLPLFREVGGEEPLEDDAEPQEQKTDS
jgi:hypothetical protein